MKSNLQSRSGVALVIVLGFLVLISALAVAFFSSVTTELKASRNFASGVSTRQLAESSVNIVQGQIREATSRTNGAWASQPGMIRVYRSGGTASEKADAFFKLYSSDNMVVTASNLSTFLQTSDYDKDWDKNPVLWTDLNSPVLVRDPLNASVDDVPRFPIIDPRALDEVEGFDYKEDKVNLTKGGTSNTNDRRLPMPVRWIYVLQDGTLTTPSAGGSSGTTAVFNTQAYKMPTKDNPIVGRIAFWADDETSKVNLNTAGGHISASNVLPTGYDETNYAGSYWDTPRFYTTFDRGMPNRESIGEAGAEQNRAGRPVPGQASGGLAICQLLQNEFQRYPGHPATTSLGMIFTNMATNTSVLSTEQMYKILPRLGITNSQGLTPGSSEGGTKRVIKGKDLPNPTSDDLQLQPKQDRLYSSVDELVFAASNNSVTTGDPTKPSYERAKNDSVLQATDVITPEFVDKFRFFLTAQSRAPELNLFGQPRVTIWPVRHETATEAKSGLNAFDNVILFCSTIGSATTATNRPDTTTTPATGGPFRYIFTRKEVVPGQDTDSSGNFTSGYTEDIDRARNVQLMNYLKTMTNRKIPGWGKSLEDKYGVNNRNAILTEIFDYIRCANTRDTTTAIAGGKVIKFAERGIIKPSQPTYLGGSKTPSGFGRFPTINEATLVFYYAGPKMDPAANVNGQSNVGWSKWDSTQPNKKYAYIDPAPGNTNKQPNRLMRCFLLFSTFNPMQGYAPFTNPVFNDPKIKIEVTGLSNLKISGHISGDISWPSGTLSTMINVAPGSTWGGRNFGGYEGFMHTLAGSGTSAAPYKIRWAPSVPLASGDKGDSTGAGLLLSSFSNEFMKTGVPSAPSAAQWAQQEYYPFQSGLPAAEFAYNKSTFAFNPTGSVNVRLLYGGVEIQRLTLDFPAAASWPVPKGDPGKLPSGDTLTTADTTTWLRIPDNATSGDVNMKTYYWTGNGTFFANPARKIGTTPTNYKYETSLQASWSFATRLAWAQQHSHNPSTTGAARTPINHYGDRWRCIVQPGDVVKSLLYWDGKNDTGGNLTGVDDIKSGDLRMALVTKTIPASDFRPHPDFSAGWARSNMLRLGEGSPYFPLNYPSGVLLAGSATTNVNLEGSFGNHVRVSGLGSPVAGQPNRFPANRAFGNLPWGAGTNPKGVASVMRSDGQPGDFDTGIGSFPDGPYSNKPDEGNVIVAYFDTQLDRWIYPIPYFGTWAYEEPGNTYTSPFRQMPSAVMMGSLLSRVADNKHWETLAFCPRPAGTAHPGNVDPKDHLLLDLFHMPIVEPYPISEPFSTAGKVNLNYKIMPFDYITRSTALRATLHPVRVVGVPSTDFNKYKSGTPGSTAPANTYDNDSASGRNQTPPLTTNYRKILDRDATIGWDKANRDVLAPLQGFEKFFAEGATNPDLGFFKSPSQICEMFLYPDDATTEANLSTWWALRTLTGDNVREKPYADLMPRICTKSNTYNVHVRVQTLRQLPRDNADDYAKWNEGRDAVLGEYRGATTIERYIDPADPRFNSNHPEYINPDNDSIEKLYRFRTVVNKKFAPQ